MITTCLTADSCAFLIISKQSLNENDFLKLSWVLDLKLDLVTLPLKGSFVGTKKEMVTPWSTNATEIATAMGIGGVNRIEIFRSLLEKEVEEKEAPQYDSMLETVYSELNEKTLTIDQKPEEDFFIDDIEQFNKQEGLALSDEEVNFLKTAAIEVLNRKFTDAEIYGFGQINSEHCRHKIFNGEFIIDGEKKSVSLFALIKETSKHSPRNLVSSYKDNVAFIKGPRIKQFLARKTKDGSYKFLLEETDSVISLKAETHNAPTTVEPFYGAATGSGGEIRDRMAGGTGSLPLVGTAVYMTSYPRLANHSAESSIAPREWKYQTPEQILIKASNGASDFGNKFGQPLINGSLLTFEGKIEEETTAFDKTILLAGGVGYARSKDAQKKTASVGDALVVLGGENYRIGMAGGSFCSDDAGKLSQQIDLSAVQRANPEMQKRAYNVIRTLIEKENNPIKLVHDHGAGGHLNCFSELLDPQGGVIEIDKLLLGDQTLSPREILSNESQERMGLIVEKSALEEIKQIAEREKSPMAVVGEITGDKKIVCRKAEGRPSVDLPLEILFDSAPKIVLTDKTKKYLPQPIKFEINTGENLISAIKQVLSLEAVACKDWLTNKVDRSVTGLIALQQCCGPFQFPLNNLGITAISYENSCGIATALGHAPIPGLIDAQAGSRLSIAESLTNIVWVVLKEGLDSVVLSANWMWPAKQSGENARLYNAVEAYSKFAQELGIAVPTGKDSLSMTIKYEDGSQVKSPGTVITTAVAECEDVSLCITPDLKPDSDSKIIYINLSGNSDLNLGGSSFAQTLGEIGDYAPDCSAESLKSGFNLVQKLIKENKILAGHDISSGGFISAILEMSFAGDVGIEVKIPDELSGNLIGFLFCEKPSILLQVKEQDLKQIQGLFKSADLECFEIADVIPTSKQIVLSSKTLSFSSSIKDLRASWLKTSYLLDSKQTKPQKAQERFENFGKFPLTYNFPESLKNQDYSKKLFSISKNKKIPAGILRDKGTNGDRELAYAMSVAGFDVKDITVSDLIAGREDLSDLYFVGFPGGFSHSDVFGSAKGWAGSCKFNERANSAISKFFLRSDTISIGVCNGCQFLVAMGLVCPEHGDSQPKMLHNSSGKFESCFVNVDVKKTDSIFLKPLIGARLGVWLAHGEGNFSFPIDESNYDIPLKFIDSAYPINPNGSNFNAAAISSKEGRHLAIMPHIERSLFTFNWSYYPYNEKPVNSSTNISKFSPWIESFIAARNVFE